MKTNMALYMKIRRTDRLLKLREMLGGVCVKCGSQENLDFDHIDPSTKTQNISSAFMLDGPWKRLLEEVDKCQLLCRSCHIKKSKENGDPSGGGWNRIDDPKHGTAKMYNDSCRCEVCRNWKREYRAGRMDSLGGIND